ncbi:hypothetical protein ACFP56_06910 [Paenibacillus septentrionalis]|uniref:Uncharacterized protein n=1 Tax=Paenibacillus septentrionalis TaxID=429342 RepID=A0ABW1V3N0_9BACL
MIKRIIKPNQLMLTGKASDIKKALQAMLASNDSRATVTEYTHRSAELNKANG